MAKEQRRLPIKFPEKVLPGIYANQMVVSHTREEFLMDFINLFPPEGVVNARIIVSPGHLKRMIRALGENLARYEAAESGEMSADEGEGVWIVAGPEDLAEVRGSFLTTNTMFLALD